MARRSTHHPVRKIFGLLSTIAIAGAVVWAAGNEPGHLAGLIALWLVAIPLFPLAYLAVVFILPALLTGLLVPRSWRIKYRHKHGRVGAKSAYIPQRLRQAIYFADRHRCISCDARHDLQVDHAIPWAGGGITSILNCFTLCAKENNVKSNYSVDRDGYVHYRAFTGDADLARVSHNKKLQWAANILAIEKRKRWNVVRWLRLAWAML